MKSQTKYIILACAMALCKACKKAPTPTQSNQPTAPTYTIGNGGTDTIIWTPGYYTMAGPSRSEIKASLENNDTVVIFADTSYNAREFMRFMSTGAWKGCADSLKYNMICASPKTINYGGTLTPDTIYQNPLWQYPPYMDRSGMSADVTGQLGNFGFNIVPFNGRGQR